MENAIIQAYIDYYLGTFFNNSIKTDLIRLKYVFQNFVFVVTKMCIFVKVKSLRNSEGTPWVFDTCMTKFHAHSTTVWKFWSDKKKSTIFGNFVESIYLHANIAPLRHTCNTITNHVPNFMNIRAIFLAQCFRNNLPSRNLTKFC